MKCYGDKCKKKETCWLYLRPETPYNQKYIESKKNCQEYVEIKKAKYNRRNK